MYSASHHTKRRSPRAPIAAPAQVAVGLDRYAATVSQISEGGLRLETDRELPKTRLVVAFELPGHGALRVLGEVCWQKTTPKIRGYGCAFKEMTPATQLQINAYVKKMKHDCSELQLMLALNKPRSAWDKLAREVGIHHLIDQVEIKEFLGRAMEALQSNNR